MKRSITSALCLLAVAVPFSVASQDLAMTAGKNAKVLLDNDKVRVIELVIPPGGKTGMHSHGDNVVYYLADGDSSQTMADGTTKARHTKAGDTLWSGPVTHDTTNTGKTPAKALVIELKAK
ncbi:hypothetical protein GCM10027431_15630 [Lysobacter rhizosphaerae]